MESAFVKIVIISDGAMEWYKKVLLNGNIQQDLFCAWLSMQH